jgi:hypothetical protein
MKISLAAPPFAMLGDSMIKMIFALMPPFVGIVHYLPLLKPSLKIQILRVHRIPLWK